MQNIRPRRTSANRVARGSDIHLLKSQIFRELADKSHPGQRIKITVLENDVFATRVVNSDGVSLDVAKMILVACVQPAFFADIVEPHFAIP